MRPAFGLLCFLRSKAHRNTTKCDPESIKSAPVCLQRSLSTVGGLDIYKTCAHGLLRSFILSTSRPWPFAGWPIPMSTGAHFPGR